jgi:hypothetical protein
LPLHVLRRVVRYGEESRVEFGFWDKDAKQRPKELILYAPCCRILLTCENNGWRQGGMWSVRL